MLLVPVLFCFHQGTTQTHPQSRNNLSADVENPGARDGRLKVRRPGIIATLLDDREQSFNFFKVNLHYHSFAYNSL